MVIKSDEKLLILLMVIMTLMMMMMFVAAIHDRYLPDSQLLQRLHHRIHHGNHLYTDVGLVDSDSVLQVATIECFLGHPAYVESFLFCCCASHGRRSRGDGGQVPPEFGVGER